MARYQGEKVDPWRDEEPGKIMHELRCGELANTNQAPFNPYYGSIDSTPLFLVLIGEYVKWTDDIELLEMMLPHIRRALEWIDTTAAGTAAADSSLIPNNQRRELRTKAGRTPGIRLCIATGLSPRRRSRWWRYKATCIRRSGILRSCLTTCGRSPAQRIGSNGPSV